MGRKAAEMRSPEVSAVGYCQGLHAGGTHGRERTQHKLRGGRREGSSPRVGSRDAFKR